MLQIKMFLSLCFVHLLNVIVRNKLDAKNLTIKMSNLPLGGLKLYLVALQIQALLRVPVELVHLEVGEQVLTFSKSRDKLHQIMNELAKSSLPEGDHEEA